MAGGDFGGDADGPIAAINVTPLVDVMLVLLVIFMVTAPMMQQGVEVSLPKTAAAPLSSAPAENIVVSIDKGGVVYIGAGNKVESGVVGPRVAAMLEAQAQGKGPGKVFVQADSAVDYGSVMAVMGSLHQAGVKDVGLVTDPRAAEPPAALGSKAALARR